MATATMATAAGAAALLYYTLNRRLQTPLEDEEEGEVGAETRMTTTSSTTVGSMRVSRGPIQAPATWLETISALSETLRFTYSETLGKWPIGDLAFGINFLLKRQGNLHVASVFGGKESLQLRGPEITTELRYLLKLLTLCWHFSKKPFPLFLEETGYSQEEVLLHEPKAGILKPAFTILADKNTKSFLLLIRGTHSIKDTLTAATGAIVPFHHTVVHEGGVSNLVLGYAHCGMVAAARWIAKLATPCFIKALSDFPDYKIKIVGHSLGGGTAALLAYALREQQEFSTTTCVTFAPAACMTWELAESSMDFVTTVINGADLVPTFSAASVDDLRFEVVMTRARSVAQAAWGRPSLNLSSWSCMGARHRATATCSKEVGNPMEVSTILSETSEPFLTSLEDTTIEITGLPISTSDSTEWTTDEMGDEELMGHDIQEDRMTEVELWQQLEQELYRRTESEEADATEEIREEEKIAIAEVGESMSEIGNSVPEMKESHRFFPPGKVMHIVTLPDVSTSTSSGDSDDDTSHPTESTVGIFLTSRSLYSKLRLTQTMISDHFMPVYRRQIEQLIYELEKQ
ncbi:hypothetical protein GIB67_007462 [Kingdonia uniflora]|uniref:Mono-/di-acylglycerol lipase n=1 Tax=Kingdonia uniflora TaxID=39325 RepID=A0A7J7MML9_9MAGN|nr:hypothetical protein GIB67_007462 [Kingdonia uniflora]